VTSALLTFAVATSCTLSLKGPVVPFNASPIADLHVYRDSCEITDFSIVNDSIYLPDSGEFTVVCTPLGLDSAYSLSHTVPEVRGKPSNNGPDGAPEWLHIGGSRRIGIIVGRSVEFNQAFDLTLVGQLSDSARVEGRLVDASPFQENSVFSERLSEFDRAFVRLSSGRLSLQVGDIQLDENDPVRYQGMVAGYRLGGGRMSAAFAVSRAVRAKAGFVGRDGHQGPYFLRGKDGEEVSIVPGSETVTVNSVAMKRGLQHDYTIDYDRGILFFTPSRPIHDGDTIVVTYSYVQTAYRRKTIGAKFVSPHLEIEFNRSGDDASSLTDSDIESLRAVVDTSAWISGYRYVGAGKGDYVLEDGHFVFVGAGSGSYIVHFEFVGDGNGDYEYDRRGFFVFVGEGNGDFRVGKMVSPPSALQTVRLKFDGKGVNIGLTGGLYDRNVLNENGKIKFYRLRSSFFKKAGIMETSVSVAMRSGFMPRAYEDGTEPVGSYSAQLRLGNEGLFTGIRLFHVTDTSASRSGSELFAGFSSALSLNVILRNQSFNGKMRSTTEVTVSYGEAIALFSSTEGDTMTSKFVLDFNGRYFGGRLEKRIDAYGEHNSLTLRANCKTEDFSATFNSNIFASNDTVRRFASLSWQWGTFSGYHSVNYGIAYLKMFVYQFVGEGHGSYSFDPLTGNYYQDPGGPYIREYRKLPSGEANVEVKNQLNFSFVRGILSAYGTIDLRDVKNGDYEHRFNVNLSVAPSKSSFYRVTASAAEAGDKFSGRTYSHFVEFVNRRKRFEPFVGAKVSSYGFMPERKDIWLGIKGFHGDNRMAFKFTRIDGAARINLFSVIPELRLKVSSTNLELTGELYYGDVIEIRYPRWAKPEIMPMGIGYRYRLVASRKIKAKSTLNLTLTGTRFTTRFAASVEMRF